MGTDLSIITSTFTDVVFGTAANSISAAAYRVSIESPKNNSTTSNANKSVNSTTVRKPVVNKPKTAYQKMIDYKRLTFMERRLAA